jgi:hypothetical protein
MRMKNVARRLGSAAFFGVVSAMILSQAHAQSVQLPFTLSGPGVSAAGTLSGSYETLSGFADTVFVVTGASGSYADSMDGIAGTITGVLPSKTYTSIPTNANHDSVDATGTPFPPASYDNILYPNGNSPVVCDPVFYPYHGGPLDIYGLMLTMDLQAGGSGLVNVWSNGDLNDPSNPIGLDFGVSDGTLSTVNGSLLFTAENYLGNTNSYPTYSPSGIRFAAVPEPSALIVLCTGMAALPLLHLRRKKQV